MCVHIYPLKKKGPQNQWMKIKTSIFLIKQNFLLSNCIKKKKRPSGLCATWGLSLLTSWLSLAKHSNFTYKFFLPWCHFLLCNYLKKQRWKHCSVSKKILLGSKWQVWKGKSILGRERSKSSHSESIIYSYFSKHKQCCQGALLLSLYIQIIDINVDGYILIVVIKIPNQKATTTLLIRGTHCP